MTKQQKGKNEFRGVLAQPLSLRIASSGAIDDQHLHKQLACRVGALCVLFGVTPSDWWEPVANELLFSMWRVYSPCQLHTDLARSGGLPGAYAWDMVIAFVENIPGFRFDREKHPGITADFEGHEQLLPGALEAIQRAEKEAGNHVPSHHAIIERTASHGEVAQRLADALFTVSPAMNIDTVRRTKRLSKTPVALVNSGIAAQRRRDLLLRLPYEVAGLQRITRWYNWFSNDLQIKGTALTRCASAAEFIQATTTGYGLLERPRNCNQADEDSLVRIKDRLCTAISQDANRIQGEAARHAALEFLENSVLST